MSRPKRFFWMKLKESFMTSDTIDYFMSQPNGANYVVLYQMLCLKTINTGGRMSRQIGELIIPYDVEKIQRDCKWFSADTIRVALKLYQAVGLIYEDIDGTLVLTDHKNLVGSETDAAARMRNSRENRAALPESVTPSVTPGKQCANIVTPEIENRDRDKILELEGKRIEGEKTILPEAETAPAPPKPSAPSSPCVITIILNDKTEFPITQADVDGWQDLYPAVDVMQELRKMKGWADANPTKRKTKAGIKRFINSWLSKEQDRYHGPAVGQQQPYQGNRNGTGFQTSNPFMEIREERRGHG